MASDDRDRMLEKALARHLRHPGYSRPDAGAQDGTSAGLCPDPELLAAYHDGSLSLEERNLWKQHVLGCGSCQLVLAHLETSLDVPVLAEAGEDLSAVRPAAAASQPAPRTNFLHSLRWLWLVPTGTVAAALVVWVSLHETKPRSLTPPAAVEVAENRPVGPPAASGESPAASSAKRLEKAKEADRERRADSSPAAAASADRDLASEAPQSRSQLAQRAPSQYALNPSHGPSVSAQKQEQQIIRDGALDLKKPGAQSEPKAVGRVSGAVGGAIPASPAPPPPVPSLQASNSGALADQSAPGLAKDQRSSAPEAAIAGSSGAYAAKKTANTDAVTSNESIEVSAATPEAFNAVANEHAKMRAASLLNPRVFWAPGGKQAWRLGPAGSLEYSKDKGSTWVPQISGVYTDLVAASAPSAKVCWIVGTAGTILRTTDGGAHWTKLDSPTANDIAGVRATDASHASISFVTNAQAGLVKAYQTSDGGRTWFAASE